MAGRVELEIIEGPMKGRTFQFEEHDTFLFGRHPDCHAFLADDSYVSRHHFLLEVNPPDVCLQDLASLNGTYVNERRLGGRHPNAESGAAHQATDLMADLRDNDVIRVGETAFRIHIQAQPRKEAASGIKCAACGRDVHEEAGVTRHGVYICMDCRTRADNDPIKLTGMSFAPPSPNMPDLAPPPVVPGYEIERVLGQGVFGATYLARRKSDKIPVAIKLIVPKIAVDDTSRGMFHRGLDAYQDLKHANIATWYESGQAGPLFYVVSEYCNGGNAQQLMDQQGGRINLDVASIIMLQALDALAYAHDRSYVHRNLKPRNLLLNRDKTCYTVKLADFGLARSLDRAGIAGMTTLDAGFETLAFTPREQLTRFTFAKPASDVWSLAATFYYLVTGAPPRDPKPHADPVQVVLQAKPVSLRKRDASIPRPLAWTIDCALEDSLHMRYPTAHEFRDAFQRALDQIG